MIQVVVGMDRGAHQCRVRRPDHHAVGGVDVGQDHVRQVFDMVEEFATGIGPGHRVDVGKVLVLAGVEQLAHGPHVGDRHMAHLGRGDRLNELRRQQGIALHALGNHEPRGHSPQRHGNRTDHRQADQRKPAQQIERRLARVQASLALLRLERFGRHVHGHLFPTFPL
ncbi:hypothetical protein D3C85_1411690 [compost metagenome]